MVLVGAAALLLLPADGNATTTASSPECGGTIDPTTLDPTATTTSFGAGSLIIPMDSCYNPDNGGNSGPANVNGSCAAGPYSYTCYNKYGGGNVRLPFGVLYLLAENDIPVSIILNQTKTALNQADFSVTPTAGGTVSTVVHLSPSSSGYTVDSGGINCGTHTVNYGGMPFVVDASFAAQALQIITAFDNANSNLFTPVTFHVSNYPFTAPVLAVMASRPKPVLIDASPLDTFFSESGITSVAATGTTYLWISGSGTNYSYTWPAAFTSPAGCSSAGVCTSLVDTNVNRIVDVVWSSNQLGNLNNWASMGSYFQHGGTVLGLDDAVSFESGSGGKLGGTMTKNSSGAEKGAFCPAVASSNSNPLATPGPTSQYPASNRFLQLDDMALSIQGNGGGVDGSSGWFFGSSPASRTQVLSNGDGNEAIAGHPTVSGVQTQGNLVYLGSLNSWHGNSGNKDGGLHILYNTLLAGGGGANTSCSAAELTRSSSVANLVTLSNGTTAYAEYLGSFDWAVPSSGAALGNVLYQANPADFPYMTGHFREYKPVGTYTLSGSTSNTPTCSASDSTSPCNWDAGTKMKPFAQRNVFVATSSAGTYSLVKASTLTSTDTALSYVSTHLDNKDSSGASTSGILGGIDWSTAAVIESRNVGSFTGRPTIAYVGARDGMLHAFCVTPGTGSTTCYGAAPGEEIWAIIPPGMRSKMTTAYNGGSNMDWSAVNVGGAIRVADMSDKFGGASAAVTRTILIVGMHDSGYVDALDISNPDPSNVNSDGFRFLWENDGTNVASGVTSMPMGPTNGATLAQVTASASTGVAIVTSATCYNTGLSTTACPTSVTAGYNTYVIRLADGVIVSDEQNLYTLTSSLLSTPITNDVPPLATSLDIDGDGTDETVYVSTLEGRIRKYTLSAQGVSAPTLTKLDSAHPATNVYNANSIGGCAAGVACQPIGVSPTIVRNGNGDFDVLVATGGTDWARATTDKSDLTATTNQSYLTGFDATTNAQFPTTALKLGGIQPPASAAGGSSSGTANLVPLSLRAYAQLTVAGSDLYANVTSISIGSMQQLLLPLMTPGTYGNVLRWTNINTDTPAAAGSILTSGTAYAGGAGSVLETNTSTTDGEVFVAGATSSIRQTLSGSSTSLRTAADAVNQSSTGGTFTTVSWFDLSN
ncbi:MAG TPA: hypothetical protein VN947_14415 [Polyangia bacterium]|nr:hypothetical protein [Polyangia bacterium]